MSSPNLLAGRVQASLLNVTRFSQTNAFSPRSVLEHGHYFAFGTPAGDKSAYCFDQSFANLFVSVNSEGLYSAVVLPRLAPVAPGTPAAVGISISDEMDRIQPSIILSASFTQSVITLVSKGDAIRFNLPYIHPDISDPIGIPPVRPDGDDEDPQAGLERLHWPYTGTDENLLPVFAAIPIICPVQPGTTWPTGQSVLVPLASDASVPELGVMWSQGIRYLFQHNDGLSLQAQASTLFQGQQIQVNHPNLADMFRNVTLSNSAVTTTVPLGPHSSISIDVFRRTEGVRDTYFTSIAPPPETPPRAPDQPQGRPNSHSAEDIVNAISNVIRPAPTASRRDLEEAETVVTTTSFYSLFTASAVPANSITGEPAKIVPGPVRKEFVKKILEPSKPSDVARNLKHLFEDQMKEFQKSPLAFRKDVKFDTGVFDVAMAAAFKTGEFSQSPLSHDTSKARTCLFLHNFLEVIPNTPEYLARQAQMNVAMMEDNVDQPPSCRSKKPTELFVDGRQSHPRVVQEVCSTFACFVSTVRPDPEQALVWSYLQHYYDIFTSPEGQRWLKSAAGNPKSLRQYHNVIMALNTLISQFAKFASTHAYQLEAQKPDGGDIDIRALDDIVRCHNNLDTRLSECILCNTMGSFDDNAATIQVFPTLANTLNGFSYKETPESNKRPVVDTPPRQDRPPKSPKAASGARTPATPATPTTPPRDNAKAKSAGMLKLVTPGTQLPRPPRNLLHEQKGICMNFCTQDFACRFTGQGKTCLNIHPAKLADIPEPIRDPFTQWVASTAAIDWVPGRGPPGTT